MQKTVNYAELGVTGIRLPRLHHILALCSYGRT